MSGNISTNPNPSPFPKPKKVHPISRPSRFSSPKALGNSESSPSSRTTPLTNTSYIPGLLTSKFSIPKCQSKYPSWPSLGCRRIAKKYVLYLLPSILLDCTNDEWFRDRWSKLSPFSQLEAPSNCAYTDQHVHSEFAPHIAPPAPGGLLILSPTKYWEDEHDNQARDHEQNGVEDKDGKAPLHEWSWVVNGKKLREEKRREGKSMMDFDMVES
ncbi:hypothetical protein BDW66DRAFT_159395 [Aspergillus desertorum]